MTNIETWIVLVQYSSQYDNRITNYFSTLKKKYYFKLVKVRTDLLPGTILKFPNEAYEFSGYQDGLLAINRIYKDKFSYLNHPRPLKIIFLNDTFFSAHLSLVSNCLLEILLARKNNGISEFVGLKNKPTMSLLPITGIDGYNSTWIFSLTGNEEFFENISFYNVEEFDNFYNVESKLLKYRDYVDSINKWLKPTGFFKGWYKTYAGNILPESTLKRKKSSIYFEHTLPKRMSKNGFIIKDVADDSPYFLRLLISCLRGLDRLALNISKFKYRSSVYLEIIINNLLKRR